MPLNVGSVRLVPRAGLALMRNAVRGIWLDLHDHPRLQIEALGMSPSLARVRQLDELVRRNVATFERLTVPSRSFAELCGLEVGRIVVATNGTDTTRIVPRPWRDDPVVALVSGAAPGRGIERLVEAVGRIRGSGEHGRSVRMRLALSPTSPASANYLAQLRARLRRHDWVTVADVPYAELTSFLGAAQVLVIPHPPDPYLDVATPVKLFDGMAAGRPTVVTPRLEMASIVREHDAGLVTAGDAVDDLGATILQLLTDEPLRRRLGENARRAAVETFDWRAISKAVADAVLGPSIV